MNQTTAPDPAARLAAPAANPAPDPAAAPAAHPARRLFAVAREAVASAASSAVASAATVVMVAGMCLAVLLTTGRTVGAEQAVLASIDSAGTRAIVVRADPAAGLDATVLDRIATIADVDRAAAFGPAQDVTNTAVPDGVKVAARLAYCASALDLGISGGTAADPTTVGPGASTRALGSPAALALLGLPDRVGAVTSQAGADHVVTGQIITPSWLAFLEPLLVIPAASDNSGPVAVLVVIANRPAAVAPVAEAVRSVLALEDPTSVTISTSESLAELRSLVESQLNGFSQGLVVFILGVTAILVAAVGVGLVNLRRKDFGRRRALGATRSLIIGLLLAQTLLLSALGALLGTGAATIVLLASRDPLPGASFTLAVGVLAVVISLAAALAPAVLAARRDPLRELRIP